MTRPAFLRQSEMKRMAEIAVEYGVRVEAEVSGMILRVMPSRSHQLVERKPTREETPEAAWDEWMARKHRD